MTSILGGLISLVVSVILGVVTNIVSDWISKKRFNRPLNKVEKIMIFVITIALVIIYLTWNGQDAEEMSIPIGLDKERNDVQSIWNNKGFNLYKYGKYQDAVNCYDQSIKIDPTYEIARNNRKEAMRALFESG
jgi:predicted PurR-regulated permease PerM